MGDYEEGEDSFSEGRRLPRRFAPRNDTGKSELSDLSDDSDSSDGGRIAGEGRPWPQVPGLNVGAGGSD